MHSSFNQNKQKKLINEKKVYIWQSHCLSQLYNRCAWLGVSIFIPHDAKVGEELQLQLFLGTQTFIDCAVKPFQGELSSLCRNIPTLEAMLVWTNEKSISVFGCWNARKSLQRKCHRGSSRGWNSIQLPISKFKAKSVYVHYTIISRSSTISQTSTSVFISDSDCCPVWKLRPKLPHVQLIQFHRDDFSKMWPVQKV